ncbi:hypothetical protein KUTeg_000229, partial [Tegillarca granosa]
MALRNLTTKMEHSCSNYEKSSLSRDKISELDLVQKLIHQREYGQSIICKIKQETSVCLRLDKGASLKTAFGYDSLIKMQLTGRHVDSLLQLALNKLSQGAFSKFRVGQVQNIPLVTKSTRKRKKPEYEEISSICCEDETSKRQRHEKLEDTFGPMEQPFLEKIEYKKYS